MSGAPPSRDPERIEAMFDRIVPHYDLMNRLMTAGLDRRWRAAAADAAAAPPGRPLLDVCCGTGDLALALAWRYPDVPVTGLDFSQAMLERARAKAARAGAVVVPPMPGFYTLPRSLDDVVDFVAGKVLQALGFEQRLAPPWEGPSR